MQEITPEQAERFWAKVDQSGECWRWTAYISTSGYGRQNLGFGKRVEYAHRIAYRLLIGDIPTDLTVDHLCFNRTCVNPAHMELVTLAENIRRSGAMSAVTARTNRCQRDHDLSLPANVRTRADGRRLCIPCQDIRNARRAA